MERREPWGHWSLLCVSSPGNLSSLCQEHSFPPHPSFHHPVTPPRSSSGAGSSLNPSPGLLDSFACLPRVSSFLPHRSFIRTACCLLLHTDSKLPNVPVIYSLVCDYLPDSPVLTNEDLYLPLHCSSECGSGTSLEITCRVR